MIDPQANVTLTSEEADTAARYLFELAVRRDPFSGKWEALWDRWTGLLRDCGLHLWIRPRAALADHDEAERVDTLWDLTEMLSGDIAAAREQLAAIREGLAAATAKNHEAAPPEAAVSGPATDVALTRTPESDAAAFARTGRDADPEPVDQERVVEAVDAALAADEPSPTVASFPCEVCGREFDRKNTRTMHQRSHSTNPAIRAAVKIEAAQERDVVAVHEVAATIRARESAPRLAPPRQNEKTEETFEERRLRFARERVAAGRASY